MRITEKCPSNTWFQTADRLNPSLRAKLQQKRHLIYAMINHLYPLIADVNDSIYVAL